MPQASYILAMWLVATLTAVTVWDLVVLFACPNVPTVSMQLYTWGSQYPLLYFWCGVAIGHILLPLVIKPNGN